MSRSGLRCSRFSFVLGIFVSVLSGCSADNGSDTSGRDDDGSSTGGSSSNVDAGSGGTTASGGTGAASSLGGSGATTGTGGATATGGANATGGTPSTGGSSTGGSTSDAGTGGGGSDCTPGVGTEDVGTKSVLDRATCLVWEKAPNGTRKNIAAQVYCNGLSQDGFDDWRVPTPEELVTWPGLAVSTTPYITAPTYILKTEPSVEDACTQDVHSCNITYYSAGNITCQWHGIGTSAPTICVRGTAVPGTLSDDYAPENCGDCASKIANYDVADCTAYSEVP